jgi:hypothetical protein
MIEKTKLKFRPIEPSMINRFIIKFGGVDIPIPLFRGYKLYNNGDDFILKTEFLETVNYTFNPQDFFKITDVEIDYLDPTGVKHNGLSFSVKGSNFKKIGSYSKDGFTLNKLKFIINKESIKLSYNNII